MKRLWLLSVRTYIKIGMFFYFKKIEVINAKSIPKTGPVLILANHQNALLDALLIAVSCNRFSYFLTRAGVFKNQWVSIILKSLNMLPVFRIRDGWNNLPKNNAVFKSCVALFNKNELVTIFPEGSHNLKRMVRPLSKGFTRIVFDTIDTYPNVNLQLVPVGFNYKKPMDFGESVSICYGEPINAKRFDSANRTQSIMNLKQSIFNNLTGLTTHISEENYHEILEKLTELNVDFLNPENVNQCIHSNFNACVSEKKNKTQLLKLFFKFLSIVFLIVPYFLWKLLIQPKIKEMEFTSTFRFAIALTIVPCFVLVVMIFLSYIFSFQIALNYICAVLFIQYMAVKL